MPLKWSKEKNSSYTFYFCIVNSIGYWFSREIRECLKLDPEHKDCFPHYKRVKKVDKLIVDCHVAIEERRFEDCIESAIKVNFLNFNFKSK